MFDGCEMDEFTSTFHVNVTGALFTMFAFLELLDAGNKEAMKGGFGAPVAAVGRRQGAHGAEPGRLHRQHRRLHARSLDPAGLRRQQGRHHAAHQAGRRHALALRHPRERAGPGV